MSYMESGISWQIVIPNIFNKLNSLWNCNHWKLQLLKPVFLLRLEKPLNAKVSFVQSCVLCVAEPFDGPWAAGVWGHSTSTSALLPPPQRSEASTFQHHLPRHNKATLGPGNTALHQVLHQLPILQIWPGGMWYRLKRVLCACLRVWLISGLAS